MGCCGVKPAQLRDFLLEIATKKHAEEWIKCEHEIICQQRVHACEAEMFSEFCDKAGYCGYVLHDEIDFQPKQSWIIKIRRLHHQHGMGTPGGSK